MGLGWSGGDATATANASSNGTGSNETRLDAMVGMPGSPGSWAVHFGVPARVRPWHRPRGLSPAPVSLPLPLPLFCFLWRLPARCRVRRGSVVGTGGGFGRGTVTTGQLERRGGGGAGGKGLRRGGERLRLREGFYAGAKGIGVQVPRPRCWDCCWGGFVYYITFQTRQYSIFYCTMLHFITLHYII